MAVKVPVRTVFDSDNNAIGLSEFQTGDVINYLHGGTGLAVLGSANQVLKMNDAGNAIEWSNEDALAATGVLAGTYGSSSNVAVITVEGVNKVERELVWDPPFGPDMIPEETKFALGWDV